MHNSKPRKLFSAKILKLLLPLSMLSTISLSACSTLQAVTGSGTVQAKLPPARPVLPRPAPLNLQKFHVQVQPAVGNSPPLVTLTIPDYDAVVNDLAATAIRLCQDGWLLDYYEGKIDSVPPASFCQLQVPPVSVPAK